MEAGCCPVCRTLIAKKGAPISASALAASLWMHTNSNGGSSDTEVKLLTVRPAGTLSLRQVTTVTPVAKQPSASRRVLGSCPLRYSPLSGWSAMARAIAGPRLIARRESGGKARPREEFFYGPLCSCIDGDCPFGGGSRFGCAAGGRSEPLS